MRAAEFAEHNKQVIDEFRANAGKVGGFLEGMPMMLLHHRGARTGTERVTPLAYQPVGEDLAVFATKGGDPTVPHWFLNLQANPNAVVEVGTETYPVRARVVEGALRDEIWRRQTGLWANFAKYDKMTRGVREIPVILLERRDDAGTDADGGGGH